MDDYDIFVRAVAHIVELERAKVQLNKELDDAHNSVQRLADKVAELEQENARLRGINPVVMVPVQWTMPHGTEAAKERQDA